MIAELTSLCRQSVTIEPRSGVDGYSVPTYGTGVSYRCRISGKRRLVRNLLGEEVLSSHTVYLAANPNVGAHDRVTLSTNDVHSTELGARQPDILAVGRYPDDFGRVSTTIFLA